MMHLSELVRLAFIAGTATSDKLKLEGLKTLQVCDCAVKLCQFLIILCKVSVTKQQMCMLTV